MVSRGGDDEGGHRRSSPERRRNVELREYLDELLALVRQVARRSTEMKADELAYAQQRLEWLADEVWQSALRIDEDE